MLEKNPRQQSDQQGHHGPRQSEQQGGQQEPQGHHSQAQARDAQQVGSHREQRELPVAPNRYALPGDDVPGGPKV